jgi:nanoRNase/pAp phosphatase (c-di-AMP/oligoRNAs hydrolase)
MNKQEIGTIAEKNRIVDRISETVAKKDSFLLLGHKDPDTDCIASLVAFGLLLCKFNKEVTIYLAAPVMDQFNYLLAICKYNGISVEYGRLSGDETFQAIMVLDTPKPDMIALNGEILPLFKDPSVRKMEIDHHLAGDAAYSGDDGYCLVSEASSTCELIGYLILKMAHMKKRFKTVDFFTRNLALAVLTGIVGDSQMGKYLTTKKEKFFYKTFSEIFDKQLVEKTHKNSANLSSMEAVFDVIQNFSVLEKRCFEGIMSRKSTDKSIYYVCLDEETSAKFFKDFGEELMVNISKAAADNLAEDCEKFGLVVYYDPPSLSDFIQFRMRRSAKFIKTDLRDILTGLKIENGGGHPGAIGFRVKKDEVKDPAAFTAELVDRIETLAGNAPE